MLPSTNPFATSGQQQYGGDAAARQSAMSLRSFDGEAQPFSPEAQSKYEESLLGPAPLPVQGHPGYQAIMSVATAAAGDKHACPLCDVVDVIRHEEPHSVPAKISSPRQAMWDLCCHFYFGNTCLIVCKFWRSRIVWKALCYPLAVILVLVIIIVLLSIP